MEKIKSGARIDLYIQLQTDRLAYLNIKKQNQKTTSYENEEW